jgi:hypothetical protein
VPSAAGVVPELGVRSDALYRRRRCPFLAVRRRSLSRTAQAPRAACYHTDKSACLVPAVLAGAMRTAAAVAAPRPRPVMQVYNICYSRPIAG